MKRVPALGAKVPLEPDGSGIDTRHLGFTVGPHEECAVEEAVRLASAHGGTATVLAVGPPEAAEQVRYALAMGAHRGVLVDTGTEETDPQATADAIVRAVRELGAADDGARGGMPFDLALFGQASAD
ncbi:electron transfer flavoprotein subunit beta/FixA family protein, partial [Saccharomonospora saliphila]|uniref:electron transfer flavoprotein subunit beta/FixA family protein n=1 Tax=Saccharomonospora saliphila TaxID=369829 RepID=UPI0038CD7DF8